VGRIELVREDKGIVLPTISVPIDPIARSAAY